MQKRRLVIIRLLVVTTLICGGLFYWFKFKDDARPNDLSSSGHIEVTEVDLSFRIPGHVEHLYAEEGDLVQEGIVLAELDRRLLTARHRQAQARVDELTARLAAMELGIRIKEDVLKAEIKQAQAGLKAAEARYLTLKTGSRQEEIREAAAALERAGTELKNRQKEFTRMKRLYEDQVIPASRFDDAKAAMEIARAALDAAQERYNLIKAGPRQEAINEGQANLFGSGAALEAVTASRLEVEKMKLDLKALKALEAQARAGLALVEADLADSRIQAPFKGFVTVKDVEEKEFVQAGTPVLTLARLDQVFVRTYVPETRLGSVHLGMEARVACDSFPDKTYLGRVTYISPKAEFTPKNVQTKEERVKLVYRIKVTLENPEQELKAGMPVDIELR